MAEMNKENGLLSQKTSEITLVTELKDSSSKELLFGVELDKETAALREKKSTSSIAMDPESKDLGSAISKSPTPTENSTLEENVGISQSPDGDDHEIGEPASYPSGLRFGLLTAAVCLTIGTVRIILRFFRDFPLTLTGCS